MVLEEHLETTVKAHNQLLHRRVDLLLRTGKLLVESLADTNRIVRNMKPGLGRLYSDLGGKITLVIS